MGPPDPPANFLPTHVVLWVMPRPFSLAPIGFIYKNGTSFRSVYLMPLASNLPYGQRAALLVAIYDLGGTLCGPGGAPCAPPHPMTLLSRALNWGVSPMDSRVLHRQPFTFTIWGGGLCVPGGSALRGPAPHDTTFMFTRPCHPDPEEDISAGLHLRHGVQLATSHPPFFNGGCFGSPSSSSLGSSSVLGGPAPKM